MSGPIDGFAGPEAVSDGMISKPVYTSERGEKSLIVLHELPGMSRPFVDYCRGLAQEGYRVFMPLLFGEPESRMSNQEVRAFCMTEEFKALFEARQDEPDARPFTAWLLRLTREVLERSDPRRAAVIGMCMTGGFALATIAEEGVGAAVACQPAFPFFRGIRTLGLSRDERESASQRARRLTVDQGRPCLQGYRHRWDYICRPAHLRAAKRIFGESFEGITIPGRGHSTVTAEPPSERVVEGIREFLAARL